MKKSVLGLSLVLMVMVSGCLTVSCDSKVNKNGEIVKYDMTIDTNSDVYALLNSHSSEAGESFKDIVTSKGGDYREEWDGNNVKIIITGLIPQNTSIEKNRSCFVYRDQISGAAANYKKIYEGEYAGTNKTINPVIKINYCLEMPNKIIDSNADVINGNKAEWHMKNSSSIKDIYAKCEVPSLPGAGFLSAVSMLLISALFIKRS